MRNRPYKPRGEFNNIPNELGYVVHNGVRHDKNDTCPWCGYKAEPTNIEHEA